MVQSDRQGDGAQDAGGVLAQSAGQQRRGGRGRAEHRTVRGEGRPVPVGAGDGAAGGVLPTAGGEALASSDVQSLAAIASTYRDTVQQIRIVPFDKKDLLLVLAATLAPVLPSMIDAEQYFSADRRIARSTCAGITALPLTTKCM